MACWHVGGDAFIVIAVVPHDLSICDGRSLVSCLIGSVLCTSWPMLCDRVDELQSSVCTLFGTIFESSPGGLFCPMYGEFYVSFWDVSDGICRVAGGGRVSPHISPE